MNLKPAPRATGIGPTPSRRGGRWTSWRIVLVLAMAGVVTVGATWRHAVAGTQSTHRLAAAPYRASTAAALAHRIVQPIPYRNLFTLANQLTLRPPRRVPRVIRTTSPNYPVGHQNTFQVLAEDANKYFNMKATIRAETPHIYLYIQDGVSYDATATKAAADTFEKSIYATDRSFFGSEWRPGVDGDFHITCLIGDLHSTGAAGFYSAEDEYPHAVNPYSNQREIIYLNSAAIKPGDSSFLMTLAHEFQHMIHWHMHPQDNAWLNEGMSMLAEQVNNYPPVGETSAFRQRPDTQLNSWSINGSTSGAHYGGAFLYLDYLYERYGKKLVTEMLADSKYTDFELVDDALNKVNIKDTARHLFTQWVVANILNDRSFAGGVYGYSNVRGTVPVLHEETVPFTSHTSVAPYAAQYVSLDSLQKHKPFRLTLSAPPQVKVVGVANRGPFWWSNRGDMSTTWMARDVDLSHVKAAKLTFKTWYDIEKDYDYGYVEVSTDGGTTWTTLKGNDTTSTNPNGASFGNGFTGASNGWLDETVNLSKYAGKHVKLRFQYITDDEYNGQGQLLKDIAIPAIHFMDTFTNWKTAGYVHVAQNALPADWTVQLVSYIGSKTTVTQMPVKNGKGSITIDPTKTNLNKVVVVVFHTAPKTTVETDYTLSAVPLG